MGPVAQLGDEGAKASRLRKTCHAFGGLRRTADEKEVRREGTGTVERKRAGARGDVTRTCMRRDNFLLLELDLLSVRESQLQRSAILTTLIV